MTVSATNAYSGPYTGNGSTTAFPFTFDAQDASSAYLEVDGAQVAATITVNVGGGGTAMAAVAPATGAVVYVRLNPSFQQDISLADNGAFLASVIEEGFDRAAERDIYLKDRIDSVPQIDVHDDATTAKTAAGNAVVAQVASATSAARSATSETNAGLYAAAAQAFANGLYASTAAGIAGTTNGQYFLVAGSGNTFAELYKNVSGVATDQNLAIPSLAALIAATNAANNAATGIFKLQTELTNAGATSHFWTIDTSQLFQDQACTTPVTAAGQPVRGIVPVGETSASAYLLGNSAASTYQIDANGVGYVDLNATQINTAFGLSIGPGTLLVLALARGSTAFAQVNFADIAGTGAGANFIRFETPGNGPGFNTFDSGYNNTLDPGFFLGRGTDGLNTPFVVDYRLKQGTSSSWINGGGRSMAAPTNGLVSGSLRTVTNSWGSSTLTGAQILINNGGLGHLRFYGGALVQGTFDHQHRRAVNEWAKRLTRLSAFDQMIYDKFIFIGDSNMSGTSGTTAAGNLITPTYGTAAEYIDTGFLRPLADPTQHMHPDNGASGGSMLPSFASTWYSLSNNPACVCGVANGTGVGLWAGQHGGYLGTDNYLLDKVADKARRFEEVKGTLRGVICLIGTNDAGNNTQGTQAQFTAGLVQLRDSVRKAVGDPGVPLLLIQPDTVTDATTAARLVTVRAAITDAAANNEGIKIIVPYQNWLGSGHHVDPAHGNEHLDQYALNQTGAIAATGARAVLSYTD